MHRNEGKYEGLKNHGRPDEMRYEFMCRYHNCSDRMPNYYNSKTFLKKYFNAKGVLNIKKGVSIIEVKNLIMKFKSVSKRILQKRDTYGKHLLFHQTQILLFGTIRRMGTKNTHLIFYP